MSYIAQRITTLIHDLLPYHVRKVKRSVAKHTPTTIIISTAKFGEFLFSAMLLETNLDFLIF